jgi:hypothetical protein
MADNDLNPHGPDAEDPDQVHAPLSQAVAEFLPADDLTRARHLRVAINAFSEASLPSATPDDEAILNSVPSRRLSLYRTLGAVAAAALAIVSFGVILPLVSTGDRDDTEIMASEMSSDSLGVPLTALNNETPQDTSQDVRPEMKSESALSAAGVVDRLFNLAGLCTAEIEELTYELTVEHNDRFSWVAYEVVTDGISVLRVESAAELTSPEEAMAAARNATEPPEVALVLDPISCELLRIERAGH